MVGLSRNGVVRSIFYCLGRKYVLKHLLDSGKKDCAFSVVCRFGCWLILIGLIPVWDDYCCELRLYADSGSFVVFNRLGFSNEKWLDGADIGF